MKFDSIRTKLTGIAVLFIIGTAVTMSVMGVSLTMRFLNQRFHENFIVLSEYLAGNAELGVLLKNTYMLENLIRNMVEQDDVVKVVILDDGGKILASSGNGAAFENAVRVEAPVRQIQPDIEEMAIYGVSRSNDIIGYVNLYYSPSGLEALTEKMAFYFIGVTMALSLFSVTWYWMFARTITAPLDDLVDVSRRVSRGDLKVRARGGNLKETKTLAMVFNEMLDAVHDHQKEAEKAHMEMAKQKSLAEIGKFSMMVAHELKNPIAIIKGSVDVFRKKDLDAETRQTMIHFIDDEIQRLNRLVEEFLLFARPKEPNFTTVSMNDFLHRVVEKYSMTGNGDAAGKSGEGSEPVKLRLDGDVEAACDVFLLERAVLNILKNGMENSGADAVDMEISAMCEDAEYIMEIKDRGCGIDEKIMNDIFNPFFTTRAKGTGLGLAIVRDIVSIHGGSVNVRNREGGGACFQIRIPVTHSEE